MNIGEATYKMKVMARQESEKGIGLVAVRGGKAYATDGRIAVEHVLEGDAEDSSGAYPFDAIVKFLSLGDNVKWYKPAPTDVESFEKKMVEIRREADAKRRQHARDRYEACRCPNCGADLFWDEDFERLVDEDGREANEIADFRDYELPVNIPFKDGDLNINFVYLEQFMKVFGRDIQLAIAYDGEAKEAYYKRLMLKTGDGLTRAILMPYRAWPEKDFKSSAVLHVFAAEGADGSSNG